MSMPRDTTAVCSPSADTTDPELLETVLQEAVEAVLETCSLQFDLHYAPLPDFAHPDSDRSLWCASSVELPIAGGSWLLAVAGEREVVAALTRTMFGMGRDEQPSTEDLADALNEVANVAAGVLKSYRIDAGQRMGIELPSFHEEAGHLLADGHHQLLLDQNGRHLWVLVRLQEGTGP